MHVRVVVKMFSFPDLPLFIIHCSTYTELAASFRFSCSSVDSINNTAGNGFSGYDDKGVAQWDLTTTVDPMKFELGTSLRSQITQWNITTSIWYRR